MLVIERVPAKSSEIGGQEIMEMPEHGACWSSELMELELGVWSLVGSEWIRIPVLICSDTTEVRYADRGKTMAKGGGRRSKKVLFTRCTMRLSLIVPDYPSWFMLSSSLITLFTRFFAIIAQRS